jgi:thiosulfate/3-mercaptopyruvate sulfurtransferase
LVSTAWLKQHLDDKNIVILDVYDGAKQRTVFASGHIPGAQFTDFVAAGWRAKVDGVPGMLPPIKDVEKLIGSYGIDANSHVIVVPGGRDKADFNAAARVYWTFKVLGHDEVSMLDGGDKAWFADAGNPVATAVTDPPPKTFVAHLRSDYLASRADVMQALNSHNATLIDARTPKQFDGKTKSPAVRVPGTIPGAVNTPVEQLEAADGTRPADAAAIDQVLAKAGVTAKGAQITFCNTGHLGAGAWFVLHEVRGHQNVRLYDGSMADWALDASRPVLNRSRS